MALTRIRIKISSDWFEGQFYEDITARNIIEALIEGKKLGENSEYKLCYVLSSGDRPNRLIQKAGNEFLVLTTNLEELKKMPTDPRNVFVVHGRNNRFNKDLFSFLRAIGLSPIEWEKALDATGSGSPFVGEVLAAGFNMAKATIVLLTGDDEAKLRNEYVLDSDPAYESELTPQPRQNVLFEAGMAYGIYPNRTVIVSVGSLRHMSDLAGRHVVRLDNSASKRKELAQRLGRIGCAVDLRGNDWLEVGDFDRKE
jgi:predicted nucleotide-binding protein